ncbi:FRG domain-containing protein [Tateyamaria sp. SN3-11]|uniref:FRG domain-containing protein n=1 Tax=Tateyamaria sp. SN3-11 TaxID=3092147 RepID=UPI0039ECF74A
MAGVYGGYWLSAEYPGSLYGQWIGSSEGEPEGRIVMDLDKVGSRLRGLIYLYPDDRSIPASCAPIDIDDNVSAAEVSAPASHFLAGTGYVPSWAELHKEFPDIDFPTKVEGVIQVTGENTIQLKWKTSVGSYGTGVLTKSITPSLSRISKVEQVDTWQSFMDHITSNPSNGKVYRGQGAPWSLKSGFHRTARRDLKRYFDEDIPQLHRALSARTKHVFNLGNAIETGAFMNLVQHHGYPTPLLDWTLSPFIAAYFAFRDAKGSGNDCVRIFCFESEHYRKSVQQYNNLTFQAPHFSIVEALSIENERAVPQQAVLTLTNIEDVEMHLLQLEHYTGEFLTAFDIPRSEAHVALSNLRLMGITEATLFPGVDSICSTLKKQNFTFQN